jgi:hypothetical protein
LPYNHWQVFNVFPQDGVALLYQTAEWWAQEPKERNRAGEFFGSYSLGRDWHTSPRSDFLPQPLQLSGPHELEQAPDIRYPQKFASPGGRAVVPSWYPSYWIPKKQGFSRSAKCQAAASTATIRGEIVIAAATRLICGKNCVILESRNREAPLQELVSL